MAWTTPQTWTTGQLVDVTDMNTDIRDNMNYLFARPAEETTLAAEITTSSASFVDMTGITLDLTPSGGDVMVGFYGMITTSVSSEAAIDVVVDGVSQGATDGIISTYDANGPISFVHIVAGLTSGVTHTIKLQWAVSGGGSATLTADDSSGDGAQNKPQFWVREV